MHTPLPNSTTESSPKVLDPELSDKKIMTPVSSLDLSSLQDSAEHTIRSAIDVAEKATIGNLVNPNPGSPVLSTGEGSLAPTGPITEDTEMATETINRNLAPDPEPVREPLLEEGPEAPPRV